VRLRSKFIAGLVWASVCSASAAQETPASRTAVIFEPYAAPTGPGCAVGVSVGGVTVFSQGYGAADLTWQVRITPDTVFDVASVSKQFVAFAALAAEEQGLLSLDDPIGRYVPEVGPPIASVTLRQLVTHTSGLPTYDAIALVNGRPTMSELDTASTLALVGRIDRLDFKPGSQFGYSNTNYFLLSLAIERAGGTSLQDFLREEVFAKAGMARSLYQPDPGMITVQKATAYQPASALVRAWARTAVTAACRRRFSTCSVGLKPWTPAGWAWLLLG
jgi:CubicO group peptidase (beta-lactamase class C family)